MIKKIAVFTLIMALALIPNASFADVGKIADTEAQKEIQDLQARFADLENIVKGQNKELESANKTIASLRSEIAQVKAMPATAAPVMRTPEAVPTVGTGEITCGKGTQKLSIGGYVQFDYHAGDGIGSNTSSVDTFDVRRAYLDFKGEATENIDYRILLQMPTSTSGANVSALDIYATLKNIDLMALASGDIEGIYNPDAQYLNLRVGAQVVPFGIEGPESSSKITFVERSLLYPLEQAGHELGISIFGNFFEKRLAYQIGVYNNGIMNTDTSEDSNDNKMVAARVQALAFDGEIAGLATSLQLGGSASYEDVAMGSMPNIARYSEIARDTPAALFSGTDTRLGLDAELNVGDFRLRSEFIRVLLNAEGTAVAGSGPGLDPNNFDTFGAYGFYVEPSYFVIPEKLRIAYRWDYLDGGELAGAYLDSISSHTIGAEYWFTPYQSFKLNYCYMPNPGNPDNNANGEVLARYQICF